MIENAYTSVLADMSHQELNQAKRDFKTLQKAHRVLHDPERKRNAHLLAEAKNEALMKAMLPAVDENQTGVHVIGDKELPALYKSVVIAGKDVN